MPNLKPLTGLRFGRLIVISRAKNDKWNQTTWLCRCDCGTEKLISGANLRKGNTTSCGCYKIEKITALNRTHGQGGVLTKTAEYRIWANMVNRCTNSNNPAFKDYGGRGITVCSRWRKFENFFADMGKRPSLIMSVDRKKNNKGYSKTNCRWATHTQQTRNARSNRIVKYNGRSMPLAEAAELAGARYKTVWWRIDQGWTLREALYGRA